MARRPNDSARGGDEPSDCPSVWPGRASPAPLPPLLVPVLRSRHGDGLALLRYHHQRHWGAETRPDAAWWRTWRPAVQNAKLGREEELGALTRLDEQARRLERHATGPTAPELIAEERQRSHELGGRSVFGWAPDDSTREDGYGRTTGKVSPSDPGRGHRRLRERLLRTRFPDQAPGE